MFQDQTQFQTINRTDVEWVRLISQNQAIKRAQQQLSFQSHNLCRTAQEDTGNSTKQGHGSGNFPSAPSNKKLDHILTGNKDDRTAGFGR